VKQHQETKVFLVLFFQKKNTSSFSEEKEAKRLLSFRCVTCGASGGNTGAAA
jgi:hypothetical protein